MSNVMPINSLVPYMLLATCLTVSCVAMASETNLTGTYTVKGECAYRNDSGKYEDCEAWNELVLQRTDNLFEYNFSLETNTFATTQGGCSLEGKLELKNNSGKLSLVPMDVPEDGCHFSFDVTPKKFVLRVPKSEM